MSASWRPLDVGETAAGAGTMPEAGFACRPERLEVLGQTDLTSNDRCCIFRALSVRVTELKRTIISNMTNGQTNRPWQLLPADVVEDCKATDQRLNELEEVGYKVDKVEGAEILLKKEMLGKRKIWEGISEWAGHHFLVLFSIMAVMIPIDIIEKHCSNEGANAFDDTLNQFDMWGVIEGGYIIYGAFTIVMLKMVLEGWRRLIRNIKNRETIADEVRVPKPDGWEVYRYKRIPRERWDKTADELAELARQYQ